MGLDSCTGSDGVGDNRDLNCGDNGYGVHAHHSARNCDAAISDNSDTSKTLRALAPAPAVMESPREAINPMSCGLSWWTVRWVGG